ncbi:CDP-glycerol glycerophosphotransferase family protein [Candidatus Thioglobus sp.]|nr:CDP-glycerol glycerophosphotransferase family protein [Candidatus Thioglobus sp.]
MKQTFKSITGHSLTFIALFLLSSYFQAWISLEFIGYASVAVFSILLLSHVMKKKFWMFHTLPLISLFLPIVLVDIYSFGISLGFVTVFIFFIQYLVIRDIIKTKPYSPELLIAYLVVSLFSIFYSWVIVLSLVLSMAFSLRSPPGLIKNEIKSLNLKLNSTIAASAKAAIYFSAPKGGLYQITLWLEEFRKLNDEVVIILREETHIRALSQNTDFSVVCLKRIVDLDLFVSESQLKAVFYVNNGMKNTHMVNYTQMTHVQLLHGDSEKSPSFNPVTQMYDKVFVAGEAAIQRYWDNNIHIPREKFEIVGRPQLINLKVSESNSVETVLYAPSWGGYKLEESDSSLLSFGLDIIAELVKNGIRVIFRPHPYSYNEEHSHKVCMAIKQILKADKEKTGIKHLYLEPEQLKLSVFECFDQSDVIVTDFSSVISDFLYTLKPIIHFSPDNELTNQYRILEACYICYNRLDFSRILKDIEMDDSKLPLRKQMKNYYLGDFSMNERSTVFTKAYKRVIIDS